MSKRTATYSEGLERVLLEAARDEAFHEDLTRRRGAAAEEAGIELTPSELAVLEAIPPPQLDAAVAGLKDHEPSLSGSAAVPRDPTGPPMVSTGIRPEAVRGTRPSRVPIAVAAVGGIAAATAAGIYSCSLGCRADIPPERITTVDRDGAASRPPTDGGKRDAGADATAGDGGVGTRKKD